MGKLIEKFKTSDGVIEYSDSHQSLKSFWLRLDLFLSVIAIAAVFLCIINFGINEHRPSKLQDSFQATPLLKYSGK